MKLYSRNRPYEMHQSTTEQRAQAQAQFDADDFEAKVQAHEEPGHVDEKEAAQSMAGSDVAADFNAAARTEPANKARPIAAPFLIEVRQLPLGGYDARSGVRLGGTAKFRPEALVIATPALRTSGFLQAVPPEVLQYILLLLTFVTPNGFVSPSLAEIAAALRVPLGTARCRMRRAEQWPWDGAPAVLPIRRESGLDAYSPSRTVAQVKHLPASSDGDASLTPGNRPAGRDAVIAWSRSRYARPLEEVERIVEQQLHGSQSFLPPVPASVSDAGGVAGEEAYRALALIGVAAEEAERLVLTYGPERVQQQVSWLPHRHARRPDRYLVAAIEQGYGEPPLARVQVQAAALLPEHCAATSRGELGDGDDVDVECDEENAPLEREIAAMEEDAAAHEWASRALRGAATDASKLPTASLQLPPDERA